MARRADSDEHYVIDLCDAILGLTASRQHRFDWLRGDPSPSRPSGTTLPVDAFYEELGLVVEYAERQHDEAVVFFDKPDRMTVSGVHRGLQRALYDQRRRDLIPEHGLRLLTIAAADLDHDTRGRLRRNTEADRFVIEAMLASGK
ncbi:hypothetical protein [Desertivibrio insolitus]|uniref:hypothetical protein n=1 Tax=Herbiconiux sp. SYSU D00978 TaxID=2812562 RepID=UPI001A9690D8|nr:hypothetical protein [Herbiconiux sp. SYSU D00978]